MNREWMKGYLKKFVVKEGRRMYVDTQGDVWSDESRTEGYDRIFGERGAIISDSILKSRDRLIDWVGWSDMVWRVWVWFFAVFELNKISTRILKSFVIIFIETYQGQSPTTSPSDSIFDERRFPLAPPTSWTQWRERRQHFDSPWRHIRNCVHFFVGSPQNAQTLYALFYQHINSIHSQPWLSLNHNHNRVGVYPLTWDQLESEMTLCIANELLIPDCLIDWLFAENSSCRRPFGSHGTYDWRDRGRLHSECRRRVRDASIGNGCNANSFLRSCLDSKLKLMCVALNKRIGIRWSTRSRFLSRNVGNAQANRATRNGRWLVSLASRFRTLALQCRHEYANGTILIFSRTFPFPQSNILWSPILSLFLSQHNAKLTHSLAHWICNFKRTSNHLHIPQSWVRSMQFGFIYKEKKRGWAKICVIGIGLILIWEEAYFWSNSSLMFVDLGRISKCCTLDS